MSIITEKQIDYTLTHLYQHVKKDLSFEQHFKFVAGSDYNSFDFSNSIVFLLSEQEVPVVNFILLDDTDLPVLFSVKDTDTKFCIDERGNLVFSHDFLRSAFYLLSAQQEQESSDRDSLGRFKFEESIQHKHGFAKLPVVNYYFEIIIRGLELYAKTHNLNVTRKRLFDTFGFLLSHDVDRVQFYHYKEVLFKIKQIIKLAPLTYSYKLTWLLFLKGGLKLLFPRVFNNADPWWNFDYLMHLEKRLGIRSTFYFLHKGQSNKDSRYAFNDRKIQELIADLKNDGFEIGLHGTFDSYNSPELLKEQLDDLQQVFGGEVYGCRQHFLRFEYPDTFKAQENTGLKYDTSLGFAEHEGFRNGYCYPFKPYDIKNEKVVDMWEFPLMAMDVTLLNYRRLNYGEARHSIFKLLKEVEKFGGVFTLLWHNCRLTDYEYPGIIEFYEDVLHSIVSRSTKALTGDQLYQIIKSS